MFTTFNGCGKSCEQSQSLSPSFVRSQRQKGAGGCRVSPGFLSLATVEVKAIVLFLSRICYSIFNGCDKSCEQSQNLSPSFVRSQRQKGVGDCRVPSGLIPRRLSGERVRGAGWHGAYGNAVLATTGGRGRGDCPPGAERQKTIAQ